MSTPIEVQNETIRFDEHPAHLSPAGSGSLEPQ